MRIFLLLIILLSCEQPFDPVNKENENFYQKRLDDYKICRKLADDGKECDK